MERLDLPEELWVSIFDIATYDEHFRDHTVPTAWSESSWFRTLFNEWSLRSPLEKLVDDQKKNYATKKAIVSTCKRWRQIGSEYLFKYVFLENGSRLRQLCALMDQESTVGKFTKRFHLVRYHPERVSIQNMENAVVSIIRHCPNLEVFAITWPIDVSFGPIADALCTFCSHSIRSVQWTIPFEALPRLIWALESLPNLSSLYIQFGQPVSEVVHLGAAANITLSLPNLSQLSLANFFEDFLDQATGWDLPVLRNLSLDFGNSRENLPDVMDFLSEHGSQLTYLDLNFIPVLDVPTILELCPALKTFSFNPDWRLPIAQTALPTNPFVRRPHLNITHIGCHKLLYAFGVGFASTYGSVDPLRTHIIRRTNDMNFAALNKTNFPSLKYIRVLSRGLLSDLERANGPDQRCTERWERWWKQCAVQGIRLEDCTGDLLGTLPQIEGEGDGDDDGTETELSDAPTDVMSMVSAGPFPELRRLVNECRRMTAGKKPRPFSEYQ
ncbi:hypothetical protein JAAARDRAFT_606455 [Jaapia argillacea MUCL 33604]|uniref:F-box domain-containing protein n=1 Tax=Jaapia argillacea MUCL 33604 TaxID=933084 RepID=A0A067QAC2_9AGAM|nr:hypothetical protein JAAARDRAFT_606455 [Jaapia argillacea MUCL 33604]